MAMVSRDGFARWELHRKVVKPAPYESSLPIFSRMSCRWCGNTRKNGTLFQYSYEYDGGRKGDIQGHFCSVSCMRAYNE